MKIKVQLELEEEDVKWLEGLYGDAWIKRMEQHIKGEVELRRHDALKSRKPWDY